MNTKQRLTELLRTKITNRLNEMNSEGPLPSKDHLSPGTVHLIQDGVHHGGLFPVVPVRHPSLNASHQGFTIEETKMFTGHVNDVAKRLERIHAEGRLARVTIGDHDGNLNDITNQTLLHELLRGGDESKLAGHLKNPENIDNIQVDIEKHPMMMDRHTSPSSYRSWLSSST